MLLNVSGIEFSKLKRYQHRTKERITTGRHGHITTHGRIQIHENWYYKIHSSDAYRIGFKNLNKVPVDVILHFSLHDKYGKLDRNFTSEYRNLRPTEPTEIAIQAGDEKINIMLDRVEVYNHENSTLVADKQLNKILPPYPWTMPAWLIAFIMAFIAAGALTEPVQKNFASVLIPIMALFIGAFGILKRTHVVAMMFVIGMVPFTYYKIDLKLTLMAIGGAYLYFVWVKRHSVKDFLKGLSSAQ